MPQFRLTETVGRLPVIASFPAISRQFSSAVPAPSAELGASYIGAALCRARLRGHRQNPVLALFTWLTQLGALAIIVLMALASFAVVAFFARHRNFDANPLRTIVAPIVGGLAMTAVAIYAASQFGLLIGNPESPLRWILPALIVVAAAAGTIAAITLKTRSAELYAQMGRHREIELTPEAGT